MEKHKELAILNLEQDELDLRGKNKRLEESRQLAEEGFLSQLDLEAEEERYRSAQMALSESHKQIERQEIEIANERSRLGEIELELLGLQEDRESIRQAELALQDSRQQLEQQEIDIGNEELRLAELEIQLGAAAAQPSQQYEQARTNYKQNLDNLNQNLVTMEREIKTVAAEIANQIEQIKLTQSNLDYANVRMPLEDLVGQLNVKNTGELVSSGTVVGVVIPQGTPLIINASVPNKDIGFIKEGSDARLKVDAYPYQQFGTIPAKVRQVFPNVGDEENFTITLELLQDTIKAGGQTINLFPGLTVEAEVKTRKQRLFELLLNSGKKKEG